MGAPVTAISGTLPRDQARTWATAAATAAAHVPADGAEAALWTVRGWTEVALGCTVLRAPEAISGLDDVVCESGICDGGRFAARLRQLRRRWGPVPAGYPDGGSPGRVRPVGPATWQACRLLAEFCDALADTLAQPGPAAVHRHRANVGGTVASLRWGEHWRPSPTRDFQIVTCDLDPALMRRTWLWLPTRNGGVATVVDGRPRRTGGAAHVWRGIHDGAHLDHLAAVAPRCPGAPGQIEFGTGLLDAESYAMAVEIAAAAECAQAGDLDTLRTLRAGLVERIGRLPGYHAWVAQHAPASPALVEAQTVSVSEFAGLPTLAESYVLAPLRLLAGGRSGFRLPVDLTMGLRQSWTTVCQLYPPAATLAARSERLP